MTGLTLTLQRSYHAHGLDLVVMADAPAVIDAMDHRLRAFRSDPPSGRAPLRFEFVTADPATLDAPLGARRPVYDTPYGEVSYVADTDTLWGDLGGVRLRCDATSGVVRLVAASYTGRALYLATHPLATVGLMEVFERRRRYALHAGCVAAAEHDGVLLAGPSGAGKSTLTLALVCAGLGFLSDDLVFLDHDTDGASVSVLAFPDTIGLTEHAVGRWGELRGLQAEPAAAGFPKRLLRMADLFETRELARCSPRLLLFPEVVREGPSRILPLDARDALLRLVPDVLVTDQQASQSHLSAISALLAQVRCFTVHSGPDLDATVQLIRALS